MVVNTQSSLSHAEPAGIASNYSRLIARELGLQVRDLPDLLQHTGLSTRQFLDEDLTLTSAQQVHILRNALMLSGDPAFGLRLGRRLTPSTHGAIGVLANSSANLQMALQAICLYLPTRMSLISLALSSDATDLTCLCTFEIDLEAQIRRCIAETIAVIFFEFADFIIGRPLTEAHIAFDHAQPVYSARYADSLPGAFEFDAAQFRLSLPLSAAKIPNASANRHSYELAQRQCEAMLAQLSARRSSYAYKLQKLMLSQPMGVISEEDAAAALFMTKRTLARKLKAENTGFRQIREDILARQASSYVRDKQLSVEAIASVLGYHDAANFRRAFKRWFGMPPDAYRRLPGDTQSSHHTRSRK